MKIVIQNTQTNFFLSKAGRWVKNNGDAATFADCSAALLHVQRNNLCNVQILAGLGNQMRVVKVRIGENLRDFTPVHAEGPKPRARL